MREVGTLIVGAGVTGLALARALALGGERGVVVVDKERAVATHTSGRNSGVAHAGYNQKPGTLKARLCVEGNRRLRAYCRERGLPLLESGILVVARDAAEAARLEELRARGEANGVPGLRLVDGAGIAAIEPQARGAAALHAPSGAAVDGRAVVEALAEDARGCGVELLLGPGPWRVEAAGSGFRARAGRGRASVELRAARLVNCAGLQADRLAHALGAGLEYGIVPIRGEYRLVRPERSGLVRSMVYPVPDLAFPFLGVHWTRTVHGLVKIGPNAVPALGREAYSWTGSRPAGALRLAADLRAWRLLASARMRRLVADQVLGSLSARRFAAAARTLVPALRDEDLLPGRGPSGIRAQVVDRRGVLVDDLLVERQGNALHVLNVVSPGLTCALPFADELRAALA